MAALVDKKRFKYKIGKVLSNKTDKTILVSVDYKTIHPLYGKFLTKTTKLMAHDERNDCAIGDVVKVMETRPLSRKKRWRLIEILDKVK